MVTILILVDGFLQSMLILHLRSLSVGHNPYFSRWFSAIERRELNNIRKGCHNPYFSRWFSAITDTLGQERELFMSQSLF